MTPNNTPPTTPNKPGRRPTYSPEQKARALQLHSEGVEVLAIAAQLNIGKTTIYSWITEQRDPNAPKRIRTTTPRTSQPTPTAPTTPTATTALERLDAIDAQIKALEAEREALRGALEAEREALTAQLNRLTQALSK
jgi:transposase-like protein